MFIWFIGRSIKVYMDDIIVKRKRGNEYVKDLKDLFDTLQQYQMKLNLAKYAFGVESGKFLGFMVNHHGIEVNPAKAQAVVDL